MWHPHKGAGSTGPYLRPVVWGTPKDESLDEGLQTLQDTPRIIGAQLCACGDIETTGLRAGYKHFIYSNFTWVYMKS